MLTANVNNNKKSNPNFGTNLYLGKGVVEHLGKSPQDLAQITEFKKYLETDGKDWNAELSYDTFKQTLPSVEETEALIRRQSKTYDYAEREIIAESISKRKPQEAVAIIEKLVNDSDHYVRSDAAGWAGKIKDPKVALGLIDKLVKNPNTEVKMGAIFSISHLEDANLRDQTITKYITSKDVAIRKSAAEVLYKMKDSPIYGSIVENLHKDSDPEIRQIALYAIADLDAEDYGKKSGLYDSIVEKGLNDTELNVRNAAMHSIGKLTDSKKAVSLIEEAVNSESSRWIRGSSAASAGYIKDPQLAKSTIEKLLKNPDREIRQGAASGVGHLKDSKLKDELTENLASNSDSQIRREIARQLDELENPQKQKALFEQLLKDSDFEVKESAARNIGSIKDAKVREALINQNIKNPDLDIRMGIVDAVRKISFEDSEAAASFVQILLKDEDKYIQKEARDILRKIKVDAQKDHYSLKLSDGDKVIGEKAVKNVNSKIFDYFLASYNSISEQFQNKA